MQQKQETQETTYDAYSIASKSRDYRAQQAEKDRKRP